jgi:hypothetical protein
VLSLPGPTLVEALSGLAHAKLALLTETDARPDTREEVRSALHHLGILFADLPVSRSLRQQLDRLQTGLPQMDAAAGALLVDELQENLKVELSEHVFFCVAPSRRWLILGWEKWFGESTIAAFPQVREDMRACAHCVGFDEWTAGVFHAMRVAEHGFQKLITDLDDPDITLATPEARSQLPALIERHIRNADIREPASNPHDQRYRELAPLLLLLRDPWKEHIVNSKLQYGEGSAIRTLTGVRDLMRILSK